MNHLLGSLVVLALCANRYLDGAPVPVEAIRSNWWVRERQGICYRYMRFGDQVRWSGSQSVDDPEDWFKVLAKAGATRLRLVSLVPGPSGHRTVEPMPVVDAPDRSFALWSDHDHGPPCVWQFAYGPDWPAWVEQALVPKTTPAGIASLPEGATLETAAVTFIRALKAIGDYSVARRGGGFLDCFQAAIEILETGRHAIPREVLVPEGCATSEAEALLAASSRAWVFGGMGSWNDVSFTELEDPTYRTVSDNLVHCLMLASFAAVEHGRPPAP